MIGIRQIQLICTVQHLDDAGGSPKEANSSIESSLPSRRQSAVDCNWRERYQVHSNCCSSHTHCSDAIRMMSYESRRSSNIPHMAFVGATANTHTSSSRLGNPSFRLWPLRCAGVLLVLQRRRLQLPALHGVPLQWSVHRLSACIMTSM
jgi:hypothetical protein